MIVALAGRRIDAEDAIEPRFPPANAARVARDIRALLESHGVRGMVSAAACGADLLALEAAGELGIRRRIVLPTDPDRFRASSVVDRKDPHRNWGQIYDKVLAEVTRQGDLLVQPFEGDEQAAYLAANIAILEEAAKLARDDHRALIAVVVWNKAARGPADVTAAFAAEARKQNIKVEEISTL